MLMTVSRSGIPVRRSSRYIGLTLALLLFGAATARPTAAQPTWIDSAPDRPQVRLQWVKPFFEGGPTDPRTGVGGRNGFWSRSHAEGGLTLRHGKESVTAKVLTARLLVSVQYPVTGTLRLVADLPVSRFAIDRVTYPGDLGEVTVPTWLSGHSGTKVGNPYFGVHARLGDGWAAGGGVRLPFVSAWKTRSSVEAFRQDLADELALRSGIVADPDRYGAFLPATLTARGYGAYTLRSSTGLSARLRAGLSLLEPTGDQALSLLAPLGNAEFANAPLLVEERERTVLLHYGGRAWYDGSRFRVGLGVGGRTSLTADKQEAVAREGALERRSVYVLDAAAQVQLERFRPGVVVRAPLSEKLSEQLRYAAGLGLAVAL